MTNNPVGFLEKPIQILDCELLLPRSSVVLLKKLVQNGSDVRHVGVTERWGVEEGQQVSLSLCRSQHSDVKVGPSRRTRCAHSWSTMLVAGGISEAGQSGGLWRCTGTITNYISMSIYGFI